jgi:hypothetical protein
LTVLRSAFWRNRRSLARNPLEATGLVVQKLFEGCSSWLGMRQPVHTRLERTAQVTDLRKGPAS